MAKDGRESPLGDGGGGWRRTSGRVHLVTGVTGGEGRVGEPTCRRG